MKITSKRRRTKQEILDQKAQDLKKQKDIAQKLRDYDDMLKHVEEAEARAEANQVASDSIQHMMMQGIIRVDD